MAGNRQADDRTAAVREAFRRAAAGAEPDVDELLESVPELMRRARRLRHRMPRPDPVGALVPLFRHAIPRLAAAAALSLVAALATFAVLGDRTTADETPAGSVYESILLGDGDGSLAEDPLSRAILGTVVEDSNEAEGANGDG
jgi:hypothetical protein